MSTTIHDELLYPNGVNGATGEYLLPPQSPPTVGKLVRGAALDPQEIDELRFWRDRSRTALGPIAGIDPKRLEQTGWGVIFATASNSAIRDALQELLAHRRSQAAAKNEDFYQEYSGDRGYRPGESKLDFLKRYGAGPGPADPKKVPYYLLIVGDPEEIPFRFQYQLDVQYAVGRIWFESLDEYARYARSVVTAESGRTSLPRRATFFGVANADDRPTALSSAELIVPLAEHFAGASSESQSDWEIRQAVGDDATKVALAGLLGGDETPALLFTASHGVGFPRGHERQRAHQGALLCQDWPGPRRARGPISPDMYFSSDDLSPDAKLMGMITFHFACYSGGTPRVDDFYRMALRDPEPIADTAFLAALPQRLLGHANGSALAVVGHVERAWSYSFHCSDAGRQLQTYQSTLQQLMEGMPVGAALEFFNARYAELSTELCEALQQNIPSDQSDAMTLAWLWAANNDARNYLILGDPAVRLPYSNASGRSPATAQPAG